MDLLITSKWRRDAGLAAVAGPARTTHQKHLVARYCQRPKQMFIKEQMMIAQKK